MRGEYLTAAGEPFLTLVHEPAGRPSGIAVLLVPPFGWDDVASYRPRRDWAIALAGAGHVAMRIDLPGSGDSAGGPADPGRVAAWTEAVSVAAKALRARPDVARLAVIGLGLGGLLAIRAQELGAGAQDLVLWAVPARGRGLVRELRAFSAMERTILGAADELEEGELLAGGFLLSAQTTADLAAVDLREARPAGVERALVMGRDGIAPDPGIVTCLEAGGADVTLAEGAGYAAMHVQPPDSEAPAEVVALVERWLADAPVAGAGRADAPPTDGSFTREGVREQPFEVGSLFGVLAEPVGEPAGVTAVLLNAGAIRRIGPSRMWTVAARRWAARGVPTLRLDVAGIGDAEGEPSRDADVTLYVPEFIDQVLAALDALEARGHSGPYALGGLCSGSYWSFHAALRDRRVALAMMLNPRLLVFDAELIEARRHRDALRRARGSTWRKALRGDLGPRDVAARVGRLARAGAYAASGAGRRIDDRHRSAADDVAAADARLLFAFSRDEPLEREMQADGSLQRLAALDHVDLVELPGLDHTLRPLVAQRAAHAALDAALERIL